jgi:large subunit ribosomal protein L4
MVLDGDVFDVPIRKDIVHRVVRWQLAKRQQVHTTISPFLLIAYRF